MNDIYTFSNLIDNTKFVNEPLKHTQRIKYTCFDASEKYLIFGATSGSLYLFSRKPICKFLHLIPNKYGPVIACKISSDEKFVAFATEHGTICVYVINLSANSPPQVLTTSLGGDVFVTYIHWSLNSKQFFYGDRKGQVNLVMLTLFMGRSLLNLSVHPILFLDSPIVQIDDFESLLLVSNYSKCILCNTEYEEYKQIGNRPRDGEYGACFAISTTEDINPSRILCARPGSRFWEVDFDGNVLQTHQFKNALACRPSVVLSVQQHQVNSMYPGFDEDEYQNKEILEEEIDQSHQVEYQPQNLNFSKIQMLSNEFILTCTQNGIYVFDFRSSKVLIWTNQFQRIIDCHVIQDEIIIYTQSGSVFTMQLQLLEAYALHLVRQAKYLDCSKLMRKNLKYFAEKAKEDFDLFQLNEIKNYLIDMQQYEMLNDLSVIFDSIATAQTESEISTSGSGAGSGGDRKSNTGSHGSPASRVSNFSEQSNGVYILENAFCEHLKNSRTNTPVRTTRKQIKDALLTVTGKFGKNIIKYKFNIFNDDHKRFVTDLLPQEPKKGFTVPEEDDKIDRELPFNNLNLSDYPSDEIICHSNKSESSSRIGLKSSHKMTITDEEKLIYNLFLIFRSAKISNTLCLDRYSHIFDLYTPKEITGILEKLEIVMQENGDTDVEAKKNCYEMYFNYLKPELIYEFDSESLDFVTKGFGLVNKDESNSADQLEIDCENCKFPVRFSNVCRFHELGEKLLKFLWSRNERDKCFEILQKVPAMFDIAINFYVQEENYDKVIAIALNYGSVTVLEEVGKYFNLNLWDKCMEIFSNIQAGNFQCIQCNHVTVINCDRHFFYTWNCFLNIILEYLEPTDILDLILKYSNRMPNDAVDKEFFQKCLLRY